MMVLGMQVKVWLVLVEGLNSDPGAFEMVQTRLFMRQHTANPPKGAAVLKASCGGALSSDSAPVNSLALVTNWLLL